MEEDEIRNLVALFNTQDNAVSTAIWQKLKGSGERVLPHFHELFRVAGRFEVRRNIAFYSTRFARTSDIAFRIGLMAIEDRSSIVRYRGCGILAYSLRSDALPFLKQKLTHSDDKTVADIKAAIDAIENGNHHYFIDRAHSGRSFWTVNDGDSP